MLLNTSVHNVLPYLKLLTEMKSHNVEIIFLCRCRIRLHYIYTHIQRGWVLFQFYTRLTLGSHTSSWRKRTYTSIYYTQQDRHKKNPENKLQSGKGTKENSLRLCHNQKASSQPQQFHGLRFLQMYTLQRLTLNVLVYTRSSFLRAYHMDINATVLHYTRYVFLHKKKAKDDTKKPKL
jgi:hypothetical protein